MLNMKAEQHMNKVPSRRARYFLSTYLSVLTTNAFTKVWVKPQTINRVALSRKMAALPQQEVLQLQPALTQSLDRTNGPAGSNARRQKSVILPYGQVFQSTAI